MPASSGSEASVKAFLDVSNAYCARHLTIAAHALKSGSARDKAFIMDAQDLMEYKTKNDVTGEVEKPQEVVLHGQIITPAQHKVKSALASLTFALIPNYICRVILWAYYLLGLNTVVPCRQCRFCLYL